MPTLRAMKSQRPGGLNINSEFECWQPGDRIITVVTAVTGEASPTCFRVTLVQTDYLLRNSRVVRKVPSLAIDGRLDAK